MKKTILILTLLFTNYAAFSQDILQLEDLDGSSFSQDADDDFENTPIEELGTSIRYRLNERLAIKAGNNCVDSIENGSRTKNSAEVSWFKENGSLFSEEMYVFEKTRSYCTICLNKRFTSIKFLPVDLELKVKERISNRKGESRDEEEIALYTSKFQSFSGGTEMNIVCIRDVGKKFTVKDIRKVLGNVITLEVDEDEHVLSFD